MTNDVVSDGTACEFRQISALSNIIRDPLLFFLFFMQGELVNNIERSVLEAQEYVGQAKDSIPKCKKFKKTSKRVRQ